MDSRSPSLSSAANPTPIAFKNLLNSIQFGGDGTEVVCHADIKLQLVSPSSESPFPSVKGSKRKWSLVDGLTDQQVEASLGLNLGNSSSSSNSKESTVTACTPMSSAKQSEEESSMDLDLNFTLHLGGEKSSGPEKAGNCNLKSLDMSPNVDLRLSLSSVPAVSGVRSFQTSSSALREVAKMVASNGGLNTDEGSTGSPFLLPVNMEDLNFLDQAMVGRKQKSISHDLSSSVMIAPNSSVTCTSGISQSLQHLNSNTKQCQVEGCLKGARGASGHCISHGGGRRCQRPGCHKGAEGRTAFCKAHGGGRRCDFLGCTKSAEGRTDFCIAHGGGRRCTGDGCTRAARGKSGLCIRHGGGKRCQKENCTKSAEGLSGLCISHGGGRRCQHRKCDKGAQGSTLYCKTHGGGKRCTHPGCNKGAEGSTSFCKGHGGGKRCSSFQGDGPCPKSVHGGTLFCVAHGGGKRCAVTECTKSARGRTNFCVRHGGGKRCKIVGCGKSAQGSTDFCKSHGEGKRCPWGHLNSEFGNGDVPCDSFIRGKTGLCAAHSALVQDKRVHGGATVRTVQDSKANHAAKLKRILTIENTCADTTMMENSILNFNVGWNYFGFQSTPPSVVSYQLSSPAPEGRVHGGNLMAAYAENLGFNVIRNRNFVGPSEPEKSFVTHQT